MRGKKRVIIGLTGGMASGKSTVSGYLASCGARVIDADRIARQVSRPGTAGYREIIRIFGRGILKKDKSIDRRKLAGIVFNNKASLEKLNTALHPQIIRIIKNRIGNCRCGIIVVDAPLLIESGLNRIVDKLIVVMVKPKVGIKRLLKNSALSKSEILKRMSCQMSTKQKVRLADFIIDNSGTREETRKQARKIWEKL